MALPGPSDTPQELIDEIIDHCSGDKRTLIACSLTCKAWVHRTRKHLFSKLTLTDETLLIWCGYVETSAWKPQSLSDIYPPVPSSHPPYRLASHVTSLQVVPKYSPNSPKSLGVVELYRAKLHLSAFTQLKSLALTAVSFASFDSAPLEACFGSLAETVRGLKLSMCILDEMRFFAFLRLFTRLESLEVNGNVWPSGRRAGTAKALQKDLPTLRGSFTVSGFTDSENGLLDSLVTTRVEYHTITLGHNPPLAFPKLNALFAKCKDHLRTLSLTAPERISRYSGKSSLDR
ncbi:hypothetical protein BDM02DRAFT_1885817 [Thelephora ganbajun]|uniref:Uncharacterized protein n=1 Tax=Thelephora ganbajun TaxID=370292 RepID=A0ACB6ZV48_THEGA|nr:hypothetical protein BDM02DRAFT_1885817 [Thelephora ganbajun]